MPVVCPLKENLAFHWESAESKVFLAWMGYSCLMNICSSGTFFGWGKNAFWKHLKHFVCFFPDFPRWVPELPQKFAGDIGDRVSLTCSVRAYPEVTLSWAFGITMLSQYSQADYVSVYTIENIQEEDYGTYLCTANNTAGSNSFQLELQRPGNLPF